MVVLVGFLRIWIRLAAVFIGVLEVLVVLEPVPRFVIVAGRVIEIVFRLLVVLPLAVVVIVRVLELVGIPLEIVPLVLVLVIFARIFEIVRFM